MDYPIPKSSVEAFIAHQKESPQNAGLIFERFAPNWERDPKLKAEGLKAALFASSSADKGLLSAWNSRWEQIVKAANANSFELQTDWRLIAGLGRKGSLEVGFTFHRYGFPYLPGSSIKGLARARGLLEIAEALGDALKKVHEKILLSSPKAGVLGALNISLSREEGKDFEADMNDCGVEENTIERARAFRAIFGTTKQAGRVVFFDAIPSSQELPVLEMDIMNPHYPDYYKEGSKDYPSNWQNPIPVNFLTVAPGVKFRFAIGWRKSPEDNNPGSELKAPVWGWFKAQQKNGNQTSQEPARLQQLARKWLQDGLLELGAGGKTNAGYGFFVASGTTPSAAKQAGTSSSLALPTGYERGVVKKGIGNDLSFGFITRSNGADIFVHRNNLSAGLTGLEEGQKVIFRTGKGTRGPQAMDVQLDT